MSGAPSTLRKLRRQPLAYLASRKDQILIAIAAVYLVGYTVWAFHALINHLGPVPAADLQYLVAGGIPVALSVVAYAVARLVFGLCRGWNELLRGRLQRVVAPASAVGLGLIVLGGIVNEAGGSFGDIGLPMTMIGGGIIVVLVPSYLPFLLFMATYAIAAVWLLAAALYVLVAFPQIPQELGGGRPECATLDLRVDAMGEATATYLIPDGTGDSAVIPSREVNILYDRGDSLIVKAKTARTDDEERPVVRLSRSAIAAVLPCQ